MSSATCKRKLVGGIPTPLKNISQLGLLFPIYGKNNVPKHQPENIFRLNIGYLQIEWLIMTLPIQVAFFWGIHHF